MSVLIRVKDQCENELSRSKTPVVVFDLDSTLFDNSPRTLTILQEFAHHEGKKELARELALLRGKRLPYLIEEILLLTGMCDSKTIKRGRAHWMEYFFTDRYQELDEPISGAADFVNDIFNMGATVVYLTGRDVPGMLVGCSSSLRKHKFPVAKPGSVMVLKPTFEMPDLGFKKQALGFIDTLGRVVATFDNEPENCNLFLEQWPDSVGVRLDTNHQPNPPKLRSEVVCIPNFDG